MNTLFLGRSENDIETAAELLIKGEVVAVPTETVYGLAGNAFSEATVKKIFDAKGRPCDNPLIVHISDIKMIGDIADKVPELALKCAERFWPGPLTMIMPKKDVVPYITSGGLNTVGIRFPSDPVCQKIISSCGFPLAAPSANLSGSPSPTNAKRVMEDMSGRIAAVVDGGECEVGVESTVICFEGEGIRILRPGKITYENLKAITDNVFIDDGVLNQIDESRKVASPGMKYKHYAPRAEVTLIDGSYEDFKGYVIANKSEDCFCLLFADGEAIDGIPYLTYGLSADEQAHWLFERLRRFDELGAKKVFVRCPSTSGVGLAVYNRVLRSSGFNLIKL